MSKNVSSLLGKRSRQSTQKDWSDDGRKRVLHVGCGHPDPEELHPRFRGDDWREIRFDINPDVHPDILGSIIEMSGVPDASVDAVWSSHNLEHVYAHEVAKVLREFFRVLRPGGMALITMPDLQEVAHKIATGRLEDPLYESPSGPVTPLDVLYGHGASVEDGNEFMAHRTGFTARTLTAKLRAAGFAEVDVQRRNLALWALVSKAA